MSVDILRYNRDCVLILKYYDICCGTGIMNNSTEEIIDIQ